MNTAEEDERDPRQPEATDDVGADHGAIQEGEAPPPEEDAARNPPEELDRLRGG